MKNNLGNNYYKSLNYSIDMLIDFLGYDKYEEELDIKNRYQLYEIEEDIQLEKENTQHEITSLRNKQL